MSKSPWATRPSNSHGDRHQKLVEAPEKGVGDVADPDVVGGAHEEQEARLQGRDHPDDQLRPEVPADLHETRQEGRHRTWMMMMTKWRESSTSELLEALKILQFSHLADIHSYMFSY